MDSISRAEVVVIRLVLGEFVVDESIPIFFMQLVGFLYRVLVAMFECLPVFGLDALT